MVNGQQTTDNGQRSTDNGQRLMTVRNVNKRLSQANLFTRTCQLVYYLLLMM